MIASTIKINPSILNAGVIPHRFRRGKVHRRWPPCNDSSHIPVDFSRTVWVNDDKHSGTDDRRSAADSTLLILCSDMLFMETNLDKQLHEIARRRVEFRTHLVVFLIINSGFWILWAVSGSGYPWPIWPLTGWGVGLVFHYLFGYRNLRYFSEEEEYRRIKRQQKLK